ncbi:pyrroloquinoline quinone biosynthesis peptide chaperone PqqD [Actinomadura rupiterrae]|uniref:pyrroloquinoline quinone biosynthesis peptide chaperone PqqD n=1 Tax=Actinomadura rupiterrae TaxID=559627 RepID=UPI0020A41E80|nr:pyrroloquinoline quinone biosynthesis peptide chaperone PqqD [Actinomadura rupiterrae]MCP2342566.1 pyrroloquinoline quinone biosynthesis protein D [Actinomadura rupiterrae]
MNADERAPAQDQAGRGAEPVDHAGRADAWRPRLRRGIMLRWDAVRESDILLMPERVVMLNPQAGQILRLCDGERTAAEIAGVLAERFPGAPVGTEVPAFLERVRDQGWLG